MSSSKKCVNFRRTAVKLLHELGDVPHLMAHANRTAERTIQFFIVRENNASFPLAQVFRTMVFWFMLPKIFPSGDFEMNIDYSLPLTDAINDMWMASKLAPRQFEASVYEEDSLTVALRRIFAGYNPQDWEASPLNLILPSYETMWRAVLLCFLETTYRRRSARGKWQQALKDFSKQPSGYTFRDKNHGVSVEALVLETLRSYPPTKSTYRAVPNRGVSAFLQRFGMISQTQESKMVKARADIQGIHRDKAIWGEFADQFMPQRWCTESPKLHHNMENAFLTFGCHPFQCPARDSGPLLIGIIVVAMAEVIGCDYLLEGSGLRGNEDGLIDASRDTFEDFILERRGDTKKA